MDKWIFNLIENALKPLINDARKLLETAWKMKINKKDMYLALAMVVRLEIRRIYINALLYLLMTIIITWGIYGLVARYPQQILR